MIYKLFEALDRKFGVEEAKAHCDIPCGIYDPHAAQVAALTVVRMIDLMEAYQKDHPNMDLNYVMQMSRYTATKEEHGERAKEEIRIIFGDYFKQPMLDQYPNVPTLVYQIYQAGSKAVQTSDRNNALQLLDLVNQFAEIFWKTKNIPTKRVKAPYPPALEIVYPQL